MTKFLLASVLLSAACTGPGQNALAKTPTATTKRTPGEAPAASNSDEERERMIQTNDEMQDAQNAHREAAGTGTEKPAPVPTGTTKAQPKTEPASPDKK